jgi:RNA-directed DNA polymerase
MWLRCPVCEEEKKTVPKNRWGRKLAKLAGRKEKKDAKRQMKSYIFTTPKCGTPQGGVISPLLSNILLNDLDRRFHRQSDSPLHFANARLIRYADDFVVMARYMGTRITNWIEDTVEGQLKVGLNREKTKVVKLKQQGETLDFLGFTMRYDKDLFGGDGKYLNTFPGKKAVAKSCEILQAADTNTRCSTLLPRSTKAIVAGKSISARDIRRNASGT